MITESNLSSSSSSSISSSNLASANGNVNSNKSQKIVNSESSNNLNTNTNTNKDNNNASNGTSPSQSTNATAVTSTTTTATTTTTSTSAVITTPATSVTTTAPGTSASTQSTGTFGTDNRWIFPLESVDQTPSRSDGVSSEEELNQRQGAALFINDLGALLKVNQLCVNTAIIYMHRFFMIHSLKKFNRYMVATACLFLACKVEEQPRRLREFIDAIQNVFHKSASDNYNPEEFRKNGDEIVALESCLLQTLGFSVLVNHAHTVIIKTCQMIKAPRDLAEAAYVTASNSLVLTNFCVKFSSEKIACFCIYLMCKWTGLMIPVSSEGLQWYQYVRHDITEQELEDISKEYLTIYGKCDEKVQKKLGKVKSSDYAISSTNQTSNHQSHHQAAQKYHHQQQQQHGSAYHNPHQVHPNIKKSTHHVIDNQTHASNVNIKQQASHTANVAGKSSQPGSHASHNYPHALQSQQLQQQQTHQQQQQQHHQMQQPKHNNLPYPQHHQSQQAHHQQPPQHQQQQRPSQNLNKSINLPTSNTSNQIKQPIKHPSSSHLTSNKPNGSQVLNQNGATQAQSNLNIKTEKHIQHHQTNNNNTNHHPHHINNNNNHHHQNLDNHSFENNSSSHANSTSKQNNLITNKNPSNTKPASSLNIKNEPTIQATSSSSTPPATSSSSGASGSSSMKRGNEDLTSAPNKIPKYIIDQKSAS